MWNGEDKRRIMITFRTVYMCGASHGCCRDHRPLITRNPEILQLHFILAYKYTLMRVTDWYFCSKVCDALRLSWRHTSKHLFGFSRIHDYDFMTLINHTCSVDIEGIRELSGRSCTKIYSRNVPEDLISWNLRVHLASGPDMNFRYSVVLNCTIFVTKANSCHR